MRFGQTLKAVFLWLLCVAKSFIFHPSKSSFFLPAITRGDSKFLMLAFNNGSSQCCTANTVMVERNGLYKHVGRTHPHHTSLKIQHYKPRGSNKIGRSKNEDLSVLYQIKLSWYWNRFEGPKSDVNDDSSSSPTALQFPVSLILVHTISQWRPLGHWCKRQLHENFFDHRWWTRTNENTLSVFVS